MPATVSFPVERPEFAHASRAWDASEREGLGLAPPLAAWEPSAVWHVSCSAAFGSWDDYPVSS
jgi:hypothetical protein